MAKCLLIPDIHGRKFWKEPCSNIKEYNKVIFLGDYLDPYRFEDITIAEAIDNFKEIIKLKKENKDKVILLLGNHDMPYYSDIYYSFSNWHCRHSLIHHKKIHDIFEENKDLFQICYVYDNILFTHSGVENGWLEEVVHCYTDNVNELSDTLNSLLNTKEGLLKLYSITLRRGGRDTYGSCIWADINDIEQDYEKVKEDNSLKFIHNIKQVFGHTLQVFSIGDTIAFGNAIEFGNYKMIDTAKAYVLDTEQFAIETFNKK